MTFADVWAKTTLDPTFSVPDATIIETAIQTAYGSPTFKTMVDNWVAAGKTISIHFVNNDFYALKDTGEIWIGLNFLTDNNYITNNGKAVEDTAITGIVHELVHAITGKTDDTGIFDYRGDTVTLSNIIYKELGLPEQNSYIAYDDVGDILTRDFEYTNGAAIDRSVAGDQDWSTWTALISNDLLIGGPSDNKLESGLGDDFLFGGGGDDFLNGGLFGTDTVVLTGNPVDYDIRLQDDGTWKSEHVRGTMTEGTDTFKNLEKVWFAGSGQAFDLEKGGLTYQRDIAFVVDQTGSMFDDIAAVKATATGVIDALFAGNTIDARVGIVGFRDTTIGEATSVILPFTDDDSFAGRKAAALSGINSISVSGGGDFPETAFDGLLKALNGDMGEWRCGAGTKQVVLFTDATAKDAFLKPTIESYASDICAAISGSSSAALGTFGAVDTFELSFADGTASYRDPMSADGSPPPEYVPSDDPIQLPGGTATVQIFTIFIETFITPDPNLVEVSESSGGAVLTAATPEEVVARLLEVISGNNPPDAVDDAGNFNECTLLTVAPLGVLGNDTDPDGDTLSVSEVNGVASLVGTAIYGQYGTLILNADGSYSYDANNVGGEAAGTLLTDSFSYTASDGVSGTDSATLTINITMAGVENFLQGSRGSIPDTIYGDQITAGDEDTIDGLDGADSLYGQCGADTLYGDNGNDRLYGGSGRDTLYGGKNNDLLDGGAGNDTMNGGPGNDSFLFGAGFGNDSILGFDANPTGGQDLLNISAFGITSADFAARVTITDIGADTLVTIDSNAAQTIQLVGIGNATTVTQADFVLL